MTRFEKTFLLAIPLMFVGPAKARGQASIVSQLNGYCIDVSQTWLRTQFCNGSDNQKFSLNTRSGEMRTQGNRCVGVGDSHGQNNDRLIAWTCDGSANQKWRVDGNQIKGINGRCWDIRNASLLTNGELQIWNCWGPPNQHWGAFNTNQRVTYPPLTAGNILGVIIKTIASFGSNSFTMPIGNNLKGAVFQLTGAAPLANVTPLVNAAP